MKHWFGASGLAFAIVGAVGFVIDATVLTVLTLFVGANVYVSRFFSFLSATLVTWALNRKYAFQMRQASLAAAKREYARYVLVQIGGGLLNLAVFAAVIHAVEWMARWPVLPLAIGAVFGMAFNYFFSKVWVFRQEWQHE